MRTSDRAEVACIACQYYELTSRNNKSSGYSALLLGGSDVLLCNRAGVVLLYRYVSKLYVGVWMSDLGRCGRFIFKILESNVSQEYFADPRWRSLIFKMRPSLLWYHINKDWFVVRTRLLLQSQSYYWQFNNIYNVCWVPFVYDELFIFKKVLYLYCIFMWGTGHTGLLRIKIKFTL